MHISEATKVALAEEYGHLDAKHGMDYAPRPVGYEDHYGRGFNARHFQPKEPDFVTSYQDKANWGWH